MGIESRIHLCRRSRARLPCVQTAKQTPSAQQAGHEASGWWLTLVVKAGHNCAPPICLCMPYVHSRDISFKAQIQRKPLLPPPPTHTKHKQLLAIWHGIPKLASTALSLLSWARTQGCMKVCSLPNSYSCSWNGNMRLGEAKSKEGLAK